MSQPVRSRRLPRLKRRLTVSVHDGWKGEVVDLSAVGLRIRTVLEIPVGQEVEGALLLDEGMAIPFKARVAWCSPPEHLAQVPAEVGLELTEVSEVYSGLVAELFAQEV